jgi:predicted DNA-binding transcriptional regulator YafY
MARGDSLARQFTLWKLLDERREVSVGEAARELGYTTRTIYRDLAVLQRMGVPLYQESQGARARWRVVDGYRRRLSLSFSFAELIALFAGRELLAGLSGTFLHGAAISAIEKVREAVPKEIANRAAAAARQLSASPGDIHSHRRASEVLENLFAAIERHETIELCYRKPGSRRAGSRLVDPYHLHVQAGALYLIGFCHARRGIRTFLVDRAVALKGTGRFFERNAGIDLGEILQGRFGPWSGRRERVKLRFDRKAASFVAERELHASQRLQWRSGGELDLQLDLPICEPLVAWIMGWGSHVEVLAPLRLAKRVREEHRAAAARGEKSL